MPVEDAPERRWRGLPGGTGAPGRGSPTRLRDAAATLLACCGALAALCVFFAVIGAVDLPP
jgi:hypothetical protein